MTTQTIAGQFLDEVRQHTTSQVRIRCSEQLVSESFSVPYQDLSLRHSPLAIGDADQTADQWLLSWGMSQALLDQVIADNAYLIHNRHEDGSRHLEIRFSDQSYITYERF